MKYLNEVPVLQLIVEPINGWYLTTVVLEGSPNEGMGGIDRWTDCAIGQYSRIKDRIKSGVTINNQEVTKKRLAEYKKKYSKTMTQTVIKRFPGMDRKEVQDVYAKSERQSINATMTAMGFTRLDSLNDEKLVA